MNLSGNTLSLTEAVTKPLPATQQRRRWVRAWQVRGERAPGELEDQDVPQRLHLQVRPTLLVPAPPLPPYVSLLVTLTLSLVASPRFAHSEQELRVVGAGEYN